MIAAVSAVIGFGVASCSDDDKDGDKGLVVPSPEVSDLGGVRLMSVGDILFSYNADGTLRQTNDEGDKITIDYAKGTATFTEGDWSQVAHFTTNDKGYLASISVSGTDNVNWQFQYDGEGHLTECVIKEVYNSPEGKEEDIVKWKLTWRDGLLTNTDVTGSSKSNEYNETWTNNITYSYTDAPENNYLQYSNGLVNSIDLDSSLEPLMYAGIFGKGTVKHHTASVEVFNGRTIHYGEVNEDSYTENFSYEYVLNEKGLLEREIGNSDPDYPYEVVYTYSSGSKAKAQSVGGRSAKAEKHRANIRKHIGLFGRR